MAFRFSYVCQLLTDLENVYTRDPPYIPKLCDEEVRRKTEYWFRCHRRQIDAGDVDGVALLSLLLPEKRTDRIYGLQEARLCKLLARCLHLNRENVGILEAWKQPKHGGLGNCVQRVLKAFDCERKPGAYVTIQEVDFVLQNLAFGNRFSSPAVRSFSTTSSSIEEQLGQLLRRFDSAEAKWFTRVLLKNLSPVQIDTRLVVSEFHFLLPDLLRFQDSFSDAIAVLKSSLEHYSSKPNQDTQQAARKEASKLLVPAIGVKVGRQTFFKARSMQHCVNMCADQRWSAERKYDGEFCEVHVDLSKGDRCLQIFSKSNKDSTDDRRGIHQTLWKSLRIGEPGCAFRSRCILVGELVVWSDQEQRILDFYHIRKHVSRSGTFLGRDKDSQIKPGEHLMIIYFDIVLLDDEMLLRRSYTERRLRLKDVVRCKQGRAMTSERAIIDFGKGRESRIQLCYQFAAAIAHRCEGLLLKPVDMPYFRFGYDEKGNEKGFVIKLKKDYMQELGELRDVADFAVVGASYDPRLAHRSNTRGLDLTTFHLGCCVNRDHATRFGQVPKFEVVAMITMDQCIPPHELQALNTYARFNNLPFRRTGDALAEPIRIDLVLTQGPESKMDVVLSEPCVVEVLGSGFDRPPNKNYFMLRHPRILKLHSDRSWQDACSFYELQCLSQAARNAADEGESQEMAQLVKKLEDKFKRKDERDAERRSSTPRTESGCSPQVRSSTQQTTSPDSSMTRSKRSPPKAAPPILIREDTSERDDGYERLNAMALPTPPTSSATDQAADASAQKRKAHPGQEAISQKRLKRSEKSSSLRQLDAALLPVSGNTTIRKVVRFASSPRSSPRVPKITHKEDKLFACRNPACPFSKSVIFLAPCVRNFLWVSDSLLSWHGAEQVSELSFWSRDTQDMEALGPEVAESLSYPEHQKVILVESHRLEATLQCVEAVKRLSVRDLILFYDWRVLENWKNAEDDEGKSTDDSILVQILEESFFGLTCWSSEQAKVVFMHKDLVRMPQQWLKD